MATRKGYDFVQGVEHPKERQKKVVIYDGDSIKYACSYTGRDEFGNKKPDYTEEQYDIAEGILTDNLLKIYNAIEEFYDIEESFICVKGNKNFRVDIYPEYKANRPPSLPIINHLHKYMIECHNAIEAPTGEADDMVYTLAKKYGDKAIIVSRDGDLLQIPGLHYNDQKEKWTLVGEEEGKHHLAVKILIGDSGDNVNLSPKIGISYADKVLHPGMSNYQYIKNIYKGYLKAWKGDSVLAKKNMKLCYQLLKLHEI